jgi:Bacterial Ig domain
VDINNLNVDESMGYGVKAIGPSGNNNIVNLIIHDSRVSVHPVGLWNNGSAPNIAIELWQVNLVGCEIYNTYVDNTISLINSNATPSTGIQTIRVHHNTIDMETRSKGAGYGMELTIHDAEIDHNYFLKGVYGIANWDNPMKNWSIHHNTFYAIQGQYPGEVVRSQWSGLHNVKLYNNTVEFASNKTMNVVGLYGGASDNIDVKNNLFINNNTGYSYYPNQFVHMENGATLNTLTVQNNSFSGLPIGSVIGTYTNNQTSDPQITKTGNRPDPYYTPKVGSSLIDAGLNVGYPYIGSLPDIGANEFGGTNLIPQVSITSPSINATFTANSSITIDANAINGTFSKVEFYNGTTLIGQDLVSPYSFTWTNVAAGNYSLVVKAIDMAGAAFSSASVPITVTSSGTITLGLDSSNASLSGTVTSGSDAQALGGTFFYVAPGNGKNYYIPPPGAATFNFQLAKAANYVVWAKVKSSSSDNQYFNMYNGNGKWFVWGAGIHTSWTWVKVTDGSSAALFPFVQGTNQFTMGWLDDNVKVDQVYVTSDMSFVPTT